MEEVIDITTHYDLETIVKQLEALVGHKATLDRKFRLEYLLGYITDEQLTSFGFKFISMSNGSGDETPIYRFGDIEAVFVGSIAHIYTATTL